MLTRTGLPNVVPLSLENITCTRGVFCAPVYQETATRSPIALAEAALIGQALIFHLSGLGILEADQRSFSSRFDASSTRYVYWELDLTHPAPGHRIQTAIRCVYLRSNGVTFGESNWTITVDSSWTQSQTTYGLGWSTPGNWPADSYRVDCWADGKVIAERSFSIT